MMGGENLIVGTIKEIKNNENRVGLAPSGAKELTKAGHTVFVEKGAGLGSGFKDEEYTAAGAQLLATPKEVCTKSDMVIKVKEPLPQEYDHFREDQILFTYFHFASGKQLTDEMLKRKICCVAYETVEKDGKLPLLKPMSEVAGQMAVIMGAYYLAKPFQGRGMLLSPVENTKPSKTVIIGGGVVGENALMNAYGLRGDVVLFELSDKRIAELKKKYPKARFEKSDKAKVAKEILDADLVVGAVLVEGAKAPKVISKDMVLTMQDGSVIVDVAIDQGGCVETSHATTHADPVYKVGGVTHYCVANMPGAYPRTSTIALTTATLPYAIKLANKGLKALKDDDGFMRGLNIYKGKITHKGVADAFGLPFVEPKTLV